MRLSLPGLLYTFLVLVRDTLAQARAAGVTWGLLGITALCTLFCLSVSVAGDSAPLPTNPWEQQERIPKAVAERELGAAAKAREEGVDVPSGDVHLLFGAIRVPITHSREHNVNMLQLLLAGGVADTAGVLLCLLWTAGFIPSFLEPSAAGVLFAKPLPRGLLLAGKLGGVLVAVGLQALLFVFATWLALGIRTGVFNVGYFLAVPVLLIHFAVFASISTLIAAFTRSPVACALGTLGVWLACFAVNAARYDAIVRDHTAPRDALEVAYWVLPKPADYNLFLAEALAVDPYNLESRPTRRKPGPAPFAPELSFLTGLAFAGVALAAAARQLSKTDY